MTNKHLIILVGMAVALALVTVALYSGRGPSPGEFISGTPLIQGLDPGKVYKVVIKSGAKKVALIRHGEEFGLTEKADYPASLKKINELILDCLEIRCAEEVTDSAANHAELGVTESSTDAVSVSFLDAESQPLIGFIKGKSAEGGSGAYVRLLGRNTVYRTEKGLFLKTDPTDYIDKTLVEVKKDDIKRVEVRTGKDTYTIGRNDKDEIALRDIPKGKQAKGTEYESVFSALTSLDLTDVSPAKDLKLKWDTTYTCQLKSGLSYIVQLAKKDDKHYAGLSANSPKGDRVQISWTESQEELKKKEAILLAMQTAKEFGPRHKPWVYEISSWVAEKMRKPLADLIEDIPKAETPEEIAARHILIAYKGAERSEAKRTKAEAKALAGEVLAKARGDGADFAGLAKKHSDGPSKEKGGDLGIFKKGAMAPAFEEAAFKLKVGEISDVVETPFGFHIIKRTK